MSITGKLKSVLLTYSFVISISINLFTTGSEAAGGPPPPPPPPPPGWTSQAASSNNTGSGGQTTQPGASKSTSSSKKPSSSIKTPPTQSLEVPTPTGEFGKKYAKLINPDAAQVILMSSFPTKIISLIRDELTLKDFAADADKILTLFSKKNDEILGKAKEKYKELIKDPYIAQFVNTKNANQQTGDFLDSKLFDESQEEATLRLLSLEQLDAQRKQEILSKQGDILEQLKFIKENSEILGAYGKTASTDISKKLPKELPKILSQQGDILGQLRFIKENSEILGAYSKTASTDISKKLPKELPKILSQQGDILGQLKFINKNSEILGEHSKATLKDKLKELSKQLDKISSNQLVGFILDENKINTNLKNVPFSKKEVRELIDSLNNEILEKIFLQDDGTITEQDLTRILQKYKETDLIKNLTKAIVYIDGNESNETVNKTLEKGLENTTPEQRRLIVDVLTNNTRIRKALITKIDRERKQEENKKLKENTEGDPLLEGLKKALAQRKSTTQETIDKKIEESKREKETASTTGSENVWNRFKNMNNLDNQNNNQNTQDENNKENTQDENNKGWQEDNQNTQDENNNDVDRITKAKQELEQAVNAATRKFSEMSSLLKDNTIKNATACQGYLKGSEDQLTLAEEKGKELIEHSVQAFKIIPKKYQDDMDENWQNYLLPEEITELTTLEAEIKTLKSKQNKFGKFTSKTDLSEFRTKQEELQILSERLRESVVTKQKKQLVQNYVDEMVTNAKKAVEKIETTLEDLNKKKENKHNNAESSPLISKKILEAQELLKEAEKTLEHIQFKHKIAQQRHADSSDEDSDDDDWDNDADKKATTRKEELENAKKAVEQAQKDLENATARDAERKQQEAEAKHQEDLKRKQDEANRKASEDDAKRKAEQAETECLEDMVSMFKNAEDEAEQKEEAERKRQEDLKRKQDEAERKRQEDLKRKQDEANRKAAEDDTRRKAAEDKAAKHKAAEDEANKAAKDEAMRKAEKAEAECLEDMASMFKNAEDEANKAAKDEATHKAEKAEAECLEDMASMFKNAEDEANRKAAEDDTRRKAAEDKAAKHKAAEDEANKAAKDEAMRKAEKAEAECLEDMASMFKNAEDEANKAAKDEATHKAEKAEAECLEDMASMFKNAEDEANRKAAEDDTRRKAAEDKAAKHKAAEDEANKAAKDEAMRKAEKAEAECLEDMASMFKNAEDEANKAAKDEATHKAEKAEAECLEDMASMFKNAEDEANRKAAEDDTRRKAAEDKAAKHKAAEDEANKAAKDEAMRKAEKAEAECLEDMASMFKNAEDEANKAAKDEATHKAEKAEAECLEDMASMFKNAEDEANRKAAEDDTRRKAAEDKAAKHKAAEDEANKAAKDEAMRKAEKAEAECLEDMASMFKNAEDEANRKAAEDEATQKEEIKRQRQEEQNRQEQERKRLAEEAEQKRKQEETEGEESKKDIALESEDEAIDMSFKTEAIAEQDEATQRQQVSDDTNRKVAILVKATSTLHKPVHYNILSDRLKVAAIGAGDEEPTIARGIWISGLYGINKQGTWKNIPKYQGRTTGVTIGADAEFINSHDVIGIAYSRLESQIKYNKKLGKTAVNGHLLSIYGLKELIKGFSLQAITSYGHNYIKNKSKSINNIIGKYQNNNLSFQTLLNYKYRTKYDLHFIPNIGFKYDYSRASNYKEYNVDIENLMIQKKSNQSFESSIGGKIVFKPIATVNNIILTPSLYGNIERHFNNKNTKVNAKATFKGQTLQKTIIIPKQPKLGYNIGSNILMSRKNINVLLEYNYYTHRKYQSHQGLIKLKVNL